jgi:hypothetical protein
MRLLSFVSLLLWQSFKHDSSLMYVNCASFWPCSVLALLVLYLLNISCAHWFHLYLEIELFCMCSAYAWDWAVRLTPSISWARLVPSVLFGLSGFAGLNPGRIEWHGLIHWFLAWNRSWPDSHLLLPNEALFFLNVSLCLSTLNLLILKWMTKNSSAPSYDMGKPRS